MRLSAPELSAEDIQHELTRIFSSDRRSHLAALHGRGDPGTVSALGRQWEVVPTTCEMQMRAEMPLPGQKAGPGRVFLVDWTDRPLPLDLSCRLAKGRLISISRGTRLAVLLGARQAEPGLMGTGLAAVLLSGEVSGLKKVSGIRLTRRDAMRHFLHAWAGLPLSDEMTPARLAAWCMGNDAGAALVRKGEENDAWQRLRGELVAFVEQEAGSLARLIWLAWEQDQVQRFVQVAVLVDAHTRKKDAVAEGLLQGRLTELAPGYGVELLRAPERLGLAAFLEAFFAGLDARAASRMLHEANRLIDLDSFEPTRQASPWLPGGHEAREQELAGALRGVVEQPDHAAFREVKSCLDALKAHRMDQELRGTEQRQTRKMAVRLAAYLVKRAQEPPPAPGYAHQAAVDLASAHAAEGGFVDWCRARLRTPLPFGEQLNQAMYALLEAADEQRRKDNERFARALVQWYAAGRPSDEVLPIENLTRQFVQQLLVGNRKRKLLVVLMDGMSWASAVQLLQRLEDEQWAPILWRPKGFAARPHQPAVMASLPTLTRVSRAAFFSGRADPRAGNKGTAEDANRWTANKALIKANDEAALPPLILRSQLMEGASLQREVLEAINSDCPVVGVVVNKIDEDLKASSQGTLDYSQVPIPPLSGLLNAAAGEERLVMLVSDHGHVPGTAIKPHGQALPGKRPGGRRWRTLQTDDALLPCELELPEGCWRPRGTERIAAIWDEQAAHGHPTQGEHGGLSLPEVVAPALILAPEWLHQVKGEAGCDLETRPFPLPGWWDLDVRPPRGAGKDEKPAKVKLESKQATLPLPDMEPAPAPDRAEAPAEPALVEALRKSKVFKANAEGRDESEVESGLGYLAVLVAAGGTMSDRDFARGCQTRPHRVAGLVARLGTLLNIDGYAMVEHDPAGRQVKLHRQRLQAQYGVKA